MTDQLPPHHTGRAWPTLVKGVGLTAPEASPPAHVDKGPSAHVAPEGLHAVLAVDPGGTTGVAAGYFELRPTLKQTLLGATMTKSTEVTGNWQQQGKALAALINRFLYTAQTEQAVPLQQLHLVFEDYVRRPYASDQNLDPVWVAAAACAYLDRDDVDVTWQQPSSAKNLATNERLRMWGLWVVGSEHERDAWRHVALRINQLVA